uniref:Uncharacterized protein n=1 Tax=Ixodes ricinus TaxID=34613 RepID=A0A0K8RE90_IXORI
MELIIAHGRENGADSILDLGLLDSSEKVQENRKRHGSSRSVVDMDLDDTDDGDDNAPLFHQPGKTGVLHSTTRRKHRGKAELFPKHWQDSGTLSHST